MFTRWPCGMAGSGRGERMKDGYYEDPGKVWLRIRTRSQLVDMICELMRYDCTRDLSRGINCPVSSEEARDRLQWMVDYSER